MKEKLRLIFILAYYHMRARYRKTWAGFIWVIASPIITFIIQAFIFKSILKINIKDYPFFLLTGLMPWFFISQSFNAVTSCLVHSRDMLLGVKIHPALLVGTQIVDQFFNFLVAFATILIVLFFTSSLDLSITKFLLLVPSVIVLFGFVFSSVLLLSFWHVFYRDIQFIVQFIMNLAFFITPIFYSLEFISEKNQWIVWANPFVPFVKMFHDSLYDLNVHSWLIYFSEASLIVVSISALVMISFKYKLRDFYINV